MSANCRKGVRIMLVGYGVCLPSMIANLLIYNATPGALWQNLVESGTAGLERGRGGSQGFPELPVERLLSTQPGRLDRHGGFP